MKNMILQISDLKTYFLSEEGTVKAVDGINLEIEKGEIVGLVGESGCGKSTVGYSILRLLPESGKILGGKIIYKGENLLEKDTQEMEKIRGGEIAMIFQDPTSCLNPVFSIGEQIKEAIGLHLQYSKEKEEKEVVNVLRNVNIPDPETVVRHYPHEYSGGMRQRAMIAMMLSCNPDFLIADEPTTNVDVTTQAQILELMKELKDKFELTILLITHNIGVIAEMSDKVAVMYAGKIVEFADVITLFKKPKHPYTQALLKAIPRTDIKQKIITGIPGTVPELTNPPAGCRFHPRCEFTMKKCQLKEPQYIELEKGHHIACWLYSKNKQSQ